ncbi:phosphotransferase family protein [Sphingosinicella microcystinivorans]|uniref:phosphotransferase family protein n=1 Tax=Sphingosinicella microcystinivorans TaxID=335406 RepID=UPI0022F37DAC|nr:phosphotransferase family protein [Sphingosinicella microcystinivorans]WBX83758.1 phosphotransferase family protein [Sphingosinicella microcystinivorans]
MDAGVDIDALTAWMDARGLGEGPVEAMRPLTGGSQNIVVLFSRADRDYVLRRPPLHPRPNNNETMRREARLLDALAATPVPHPTLIAACEDESVLGACFYLMAPIDGFNPVSGLPPLHAGCAEIQHRMGLAAVEALVTLGAQDYRSLGLEGFGKPDNYLQRQVSRWRSQLQSYYDLPGWPGAAALGDVDAVGRWLEHHCPAGISSGIMHGDFHMANVMFKHDGPELAAIIDWELATIGDPLIDFGWLLATWPDAGEERTTSIQPWIGFPSAAELIAHYKTCGGRTLGDVEWYAIFGCYKLGILLEGTHARSRAGKAPMEIGEKLHNRAVLLFARAERWLRNGMPGAPGKDSMRHERA